VLPKFFPARVRPTADRVVNDSYWPVILLLLLIGLTSLYHVAPPRRMPWRRGVPGAVLAMVIFIGGSTALRWYIAFIVAQNHAYGTLAAPIAALLFFFVLAFGVLLGAEFNATIELASPSTSRRRRVDRGWQQLGDASADRPGSPPAVSSPDDQPGPGHERPSGPADERPDRAGSV